MASHRAFAVVLTVLFAFGLRAPPAPAWTLIGSADDGTIYDIDTSNGLALNPRDTGIEDLRGIAFSSEGILYGLDVAGWVFTIDPDTGSSALIASDMGGGCCALDLAFDPTTATLFSTKTSAGAGGSVLWMIYPDSGTSSFVGGHSALSGGMVFDDAGTLFAVNRSFLLVVDKTPPAPPSLVLQILAWIPLSQDLRAVRGLAIDLQGTYYLTDTPQGGDDILYTVDPNNGVLTVIGSTGVMGGLSSLTVIPEPATLVLLGLGGIAMIARTRRSRAHCGRAAHTRRWRHPRSLRLPAGCPNAHPQVVVVGRVRRPDTLKHAIA